MPEEKQELPAVCVVGDATSEPILTAETVPEDVEAKPLFTEADRVLEVTLDYQLGSDPSVVPNRQSRRARRKGVVVG